MSLSKYQLQQKGKPSEGKHRGQSAVRLQGQAERRVGGGARASAEQLRQRREGDAIDAVFGFNRIKEGPTRTGWLLNYMPIVSAAQMTRVFCRHPWIVMCM